MLKAIRDWIYPQPVEPKLRVAKPKPKPKPRAARRDFAKVYPPSMVLGVKIPNPKRSNTHAYDRYQKYYNCTTVGDALKSGISYRDMDFDVSVGHLSIEHE